MRFWIGGRGADMGANGAGIGIVAAGEPDSPLAGGTLTDRGLAAEAPSPTWLARHPRGGVVYAALEGSGRVAAFRRAGETALEPLGDPVEAGSAVCHIAVAPDGSRLVASCWGDGRVVEVPLGSSGALGAPRVAAPARDPYAAPEAAAPAEPEDDAARIARQLLAGDAPEPEAPVTDFSGAVDLGALVDGGSDPSRLAAMLAGTDDGSDPAAELRALLGGGSADPFDDPAVRAILDASPAGVLREAEAPQGPRPTRAHAARFLPDGRIATTDLGYDLVRIWRVGTDGLVLDHEVALPFGTGPRHMSLHASGHLYVVTEFTCEIFVLAPGRDGRWALVAGVQTGAIAGDTAAELAGSADGSFLYAGLRGSDGIAAVRVAGQGERLELVGVAEAGVTTPRHHVLVRDTLLVAGQGSDEIVSLGVDSRTGAVGRVRHRVEHPTPNCVLPIA
ncbi:beta-propeller fold lactonase family protein [Microbacterium sp. ZXX196]|uniref:lactonase family protein n=1 Tax=Microbacterium sp. ZXX196 TaxID=2609291 RepID=UPI0012B6DF00|nr:beta-propeller fold lactonase family protein [Microbacterium sp. ZXX196]MTE24565.1 beta-propeller fold lactonase family protein [Microbacterium sp. ZXX196]